jgi:hypothetical protein
MIEIHTLGWAGDKAVRGDEEAVTTILCRVFVNGYELPNVLSASADFSEDFSSAVVRMAMPVKVVNHSKEDWDAL